MPDRTFDRLPSRDPRNANYPLSATLPNIQPRSYTWRHLQLDQGREGACTGFAVTMEAAARPHPVFGDPVTGNPDIAKTTTTAQAIYHRARQLDDWEGEAYEGSSVLGAMKAGVEQGWYGPYLWAIGTPALQAMQVCIAIAYHGPGVMGADWHNDMFTADKDGYLHPTGGIAGGHAFLLSAYSRTRDAVYTPNSWGGAGQGWIRRTDLEYLFAHDGEVCIPLQRRS